MDQLSPDVQPWPQPSAVAPCPDPTPFWGPYRSHSEGTLGNVREGEKGVNRHGISLQDRSLLDHINEDFLSVICAFMPTE